MFIDKFYRVYDPHTKPTQGRSFRYYFNLNEDGWNALNLKIVNVESGKNPNDVSTMEQTVTRKGDAFVQGKDQYKCLELKNNEWNARKRKITNVSEGIEKTDVSTMSQIPKVSEDGWEFSNKRLKNISPGTLPNDAANISQVLLLKKDTEGKEFWDAKNIRIGHLPDGKYKDDVCLMKQAVRYIEETNLFAYDTNKVLNLVTYNPNILVADPTSISGFKKIDGSKYEPQNYVYRKQNGKGIGDLIDAKGNDIIYTEIPDIKK